ncbi:hypothetical protein HDV00_011672 [Rhizophlyctis rosea]|nr:hypothetical protein HDV00_011672 [Rhizophlyctis rosea]
MPVSYEKRPQAARYVLVTGGAGYIGSHTVLELLQQNYKVVVIDNLSNSSRESLHRISELTSCEIPFYEGNIQDAKLLDKIFTAHQIFAVIHFAALKSAPESVSIPLDYYQVNVAGSLSLLMAMQRHNVSRIVFSSTAAVYGTPAADVKLIPETHAPHPANPYGRSKLMIEHLIQDHCVAMPEFGAVILRYFNPVGAHESGRIGEDPTGVPGNLMPLVLQVAQNKRSHLDVTGLDWPTEDGGGVRDFIHVVDLAKGHIAALRYADGLVANAKGGCKVFNMGTGEGTSVLSMIANMASVAGMPIPWKEAPRRVGDVAQVVANPALAGKVLQWKAETTVEDMCRDAWRWTSENPNG